MSHAEKIVEALSTLVPLYSTEDFDVEEKIVGVRITATWTRAEWLLVEYDAEQRIAFGHCDVSTPEWGYVSADELIELDVDLGNGLRARAVVDQEWEPVRFGDLDR